MEKKSADLVYRPEKVRMGQKELLVWETDPRTGRRCRTIPYETMVLVYLEVYDQETGKVTTPEIQDITKDMKGNLIIWNQHRTMIRIDLSGQAECAGTIFIQLARHIPFAFLGDTPWLQIQNDQDFRQMLQMIQLHQSL